METENLVNLGADAPSDCLEPPVEDVGSAVGVEVDYASLVERLVKERLDAVIAERLCLAPDRRVSAVDCDPFLAGLFGR